MQTQGRSEMKRTRAIEALKSVLTHVSGVKLRTIEAESISAEQCAEIIAHVDIYGRKHTLACMMVSNDEPQHVRDSVMVFCDRTVRVADNATPVLIASRVSSDLQSLCRETRAGMMDLEGNARIEFGDVFIACQHLSRHSSHRSALRDPAAKDPAHGGAAA